MKLINSGTGSLVFTWLDHFNITSNNKLAVKRSTEVHERKDLKYALHSCGETTGKMLNQEFIMSQI